MATQPSKKKLRWWILFGVTGFVDVAQIIIGFTGIGIAVSEAIEVAMPFVIGGILLGLRLLNMQTGLSILAAVGLDAITGGFAPFWIGDAFYIKRQVQNSEAAQFAQQEEMETARNPNLANNFNGRREPEAIRNPNLRPTVVNGRNESFKKAA